MRLPQQLRSMWPELSAKLARPAALRDHIAMLFALVTLIGLASAFFLAKGTAFLMPGPLASAHGAIENCSTCHTKSGSGKLSWIHGLVATDRRDGSKACLSCHKMPDTAFNAHGAPAGILAQSTERLTKIAAKSSAPLSARAQSFAFSANDATARGLPCATCHKEHQGGSHKLSIISNEQCRSCHVVKFESFQAGHPKFDSYPFTRRTRLVYDHAAHFGKHYPELAQKDPSKRIPATCSTCHTSRDDKRIMTVVPFERTCSGCHLDQITGKERVSGPKGIAFLSLPGLDLQTLKKKKVAIGEWPEASEAALTPFMKMMLSRNERGRVLVQSVDGVNLQDLSNASDKQIKAVKGLVAEIKSLVFSLISGKASDVLGDLNIEGGTKLSANLIADLTASLPRDVVIAAQRQWLPNLADEMSKGASGTSAAIPPLPAKPDPIVSTPKVAAKPVATEKAADENVAQETEKSDPAPASVEDATPPKRDPPACAMRVLGQCIMYQTPEGAQAPSPDDSEDATKTAGDSPKPRRAGELPGASRAGLKGVEPTAQPASQASKIAAANAKSESGNATSPAGKPPPTKAGNQSDDLLFPTEQELREIKATNKNFGKDTGKDTGKTDQPSAGPPAAAAFTDTAPVSPQSNAAPVNSITSDVDPESWAEYGGWYQQDYAIYYRPVGHKDKFITSWLNLTGPQAPKGETSPSAAVFDYLTSKDSQGSCVKCHSVDAIPDKGRIVNFSPLTVAKKQGSFTRFTHEPHFGLTGNRGCLTCHELEKGQPYLKSYEQSDPHTFAPEFGGVKKEVCQTCHKSSMARQDCLLCHKYHVNDVITPITNTTLPAP